MPQLHLGTVVCLAAYIWLAACLPSQSESSTDKLAQADSKTQWGKVTFCKGGRVAQDGACYHPYALGCFCFNTFCSSSSPLCPTYFREMGVDNEDEWNIWSYTVPLPSRPTDAAATTLLVLGDPQPFRFKADQSSGTPSTENVSQVWMDSVQANYDMARVTVAAHSIVWPDTQEPLYPSASAPKHLLLNGDLTEYWHYSQLSAYRQLYESDFNPGSAEAQLAAISGVTSVGRGVLTYPSLGNHDYVNNFGNCEGVDGDCSANALKWLRTLLSPYSTKDALQRGQRGNANFGWEQVHGFDAGSLAYYIQLHTFVIFNLGFVLNDGQQLTFNGEWLKTQLRAASDAGYAILLVSHAAHQDDSLDWPLQQLCDAVRDVRVAGIVTSHIHEHWGLYASLDVGACNMERCGSQDCRPSSGKIPVWRTGAPDYGVMAALRLEPNGYTVGWLQSPSGDWVTTLNNGASQEAISLSDANNSPGGKVTILFTCSATNPGECTTTNPRFETPTLVIPPPASSPPPPIPPRDAHSNCSQPGCTKEGVMSGHTLTDLPPPPAAGLNGSQAGGLWQPSRRQTSQPPPAAQTATAPPPAAAGRWRLGAALLACVADGWLALV